jgi:molybdopterin/thiamine biosynthesis adenylyltransferase
MGDRIGLGEADSDRYDRSRRVEWLDLARISRARVLMIGAGALGNEVAKDLALSGFNHLTIVDMDHVVGSNLNRCLFFSSEDAKKKAPKAEVVSRGVASINPECRSEPVVKRIEELPSTIFENHDIVFGCLDNISARIHANSHAYHAGKVYIDGGMDGFVGKVMVATPPDGACVQCGMNRTHARVAEMRFSCTGKDVVFHEPRLAAEITTTSIVSAVMVREALKVVSGRRELCLANSFYYDGRRNVSEEIEVPRDPDCPVHATR